MKGKRGLWFGEETGKIIIAVIGIVLMVFLLFKLIGIFIQRTEYEQAKVAMKEIENLVKDGEGIKFYLFESPKDWVLLTDQKNNNRLCLCPTAELGIFQKIFKTQSIKETLDNSCKKKGVCANLEKKVTILSSCHIVVPNCAIIKKVPESIILNVKKEKVELIAKNYNPDDYDYFNTLGAICSFLGFSGFFSSGAVGGVFSRGVTEVSSLSLASGSNAILVSSKGEELGLLIESNYAGKYILSKGGTNKISNLLIKPNGQVVDSSGKVVGYLAKGTKVVIGTTTKTGGVVAKTATLGDDIVLASGKTSTVAISKLAGKKIFNLFGKTMKIAGVVTTFAGSACDVYVAARVFMGALEAYEEAIESGKKADDSLFNLINFIEEKQEEIERMVINLEEGIGEENEHFREIKKESDIIRTKFTELKRKYQEYSANIFIRGTGSEFSDKEYEDISTRITEIRKLMVNLNKKITSFFEEDETQ